MKKNQKGFASLISLLVVLSIIGYLATFYVKHQQEQNIRNNQNSFYNHVTNLIAQINSYQSDQYDSGTLPDSQNLFPASLATLQNEGYLPQCSTSDNQNGYCSKPEQTPWGDNIVYTRQKVSGKNYYEATLILTLPALTDANTFEQQVSISLFSQIAGASYNDTNRKITITIPRLENLLSLTAVVKRSGQDSTLTGNWDVGGNYAITNAKDFRIRNANGTQRSLAVGVVDSFTVKSNTNVTKPQCTPGLTADIVATPKFIGLPDGNHAHTPIKVIVTSYGNYWRLALKYKYKNTLGNWVNGSNGSITVQTVCH